MGPKNTTTKTVGEKLAGISIQTSIFGQPIPFGYGRSRISCNLIDYLDFQAIPHTTTTSTGGGGKGGGGGGTTTSDTTYTYSASVMIGLCEGPIVGIVSVYKDAASFTGVTALADSGLSLAAGIAVAAPWSYLTSLFPSHALSYRTLAYAYAQGYDLGTSGGLANHAFEVDFSIQIGGGIYDANPKDCLVDLLTNVAHGVPGWSSAFNASWADWGTYCLANNLLLSPVVDQQEPASDILRRWLDITHSECVFSEGQLKIKPYGDSTATGNGVSWFPDLTPEYDLTEDDFLSEVSISIGDPSDSFNSMSCEFLDRATEYRASVENAYDLDNILTLGLRKDGGSQTWHDICDADIARDAIQLFMQRQLYVRDTYEFDLPQDFVGLEPLDFVTLTTTVDGAQLNRQLVQIISIDEAEDGGDELHFVAEGLPFTAHKAIYGGLSGGGFGPGLTASPGSVATPILFNPPSSLITSATGFEAWAAVASANANWGGAFVWVSYDGTNYSRVGQITAPARYGTVYSAAFATGSDPDTTHILNVDLTVSKGSLPTFSNAQADADVSLCMVGSELISYSVATLSAANKYALKTYIRRGRRSTTIAAHAVGQNFIRLDKAIFVLPYYPEDSGKTIHVKFQSFNLYGRQVQNLAACTDYTLALSSNPSLPAQVTGLALAGSGGTTWTGGALNLICDPCLRASSYVFKIYKSDGTTLLRTITTSTNLASYTSALAAVDTAQRTYKIQAYALNSAGAAGPLSTMITVTDAAPVALSGVTATGGATDATITCTASGSTDLAGYAVFYSTVSGFDPTTAGNVVLSGTNSVSILGLPAGTYYGKMAAYDGWTTDPRQLNLSTQFSFVISAGGGSTPTGSGGGGSGSTGVGGGGYVGGGKVVLP